MKRAIISSLGLSTLLFGIVQTPAKAINIDFFDDNPSQNITVAKGAFGTYSSLATGLSNTIGGQRYIQLTTTGINTKALTTLDIGGGSADLSAANNVTPSFSFLWNGGGSLNQNLTVGGQNAFQLDVIAVDQNFTLNLLITDTNNNSGIISQTINGINTYNFLYSAASGVNFSSVKSIQLYSSNTPTSLDASFDYLQTAQIPFEFSPSLGILLSGSLFGLIFLKNKSSEQKLNSLN